MASFAFKTLGVWAALSLIGCEDMTLVNEPLPPLEAGAPTAAPKRDAGTSPKRDAETAAPPPTETEEPEPGETPPPKTDAGSETPAQPQVDGGKTPEQPPPPAVSKIAGSAAEARCSSYGLPMGDACAGYYCGVTIDDLRAELRTEGTVCDPDAEKICDGGLTREVGRCARETKSNPVNAFDTDEQIRMKVQACVLKNSKYADTAPACLGCFLDAAQCASDNCLTQCLTGDSAACDTCRMNAECNQTVPTCAGFPSPF